MAELPIYQVDAFTNQTFGGNPAAVCPLETWLPDETLQNIAAENNLSETAFFVPEGDDYHLRWFTPLVEVDLCGHATLSAAFIIFEELGHKSDTLNFTGRSGPLTVTRKDDGFMLDFPIWAYEKIESHPALADALGQTPDEIYKSVDYVAVYKSADMIRALDPDMEKLKKLTEMRGVVCTAKGENNIDFVSRWFGPQVGVPEDPVTGSAHCVLTPLWGKRLEKTEMNARQLSQRSGELHCTLRGERVEIKGEAKLYMKGVIYV